MPPLMALIISIFCIALLLLYDSKKQNVLSLSIWVPLIWFLIIGSRPVSTWFYGNEVETVLAFEQGNVINQVIDAIIILLSISILYKRNISIYNFLRRNKYVIAFYMFCGISILWSDYPLVSLKRWIKSIECIMVILILLTEIDPTTALNTIITRCSYILIPLSVCLIKYFPGIGREYGFWTGGIINIGAAVDKNGLGRMCLVFGLFYIWNLLYEFSNKYVFRDKKDIMIHIGMLCVIIYLLLKSNSATSLLCFIIGFLILICFKFKFIQNKINNFGILFIASILCLYLMDYLFNMKETILILIGRDITLTDRDILWKVLLDMNTNPLVGTGYESFWLGNRLAYIKNIMGWLPNEAHNGYLEIYLNLGIIGLILLTSIILFGNKIIISKFKDNLKYKILGVVFFVVLLFYNITESAFKGSNIIWNIFLFMIINYQYYEYIEGEDKNIIGINQK
jgi:O-antigen ligase